jgi:potassium efflux system protein
MRLILLWLTLAFFSAAAAAQGLNLTASQSQWIARHHTIRIAPDTDMAPIDGLDADGRARGLAADYLKLIGSRSGLEFRVVRAPNRHAALKALRERSVDLLPSAFVATQNADAAFSAPYLRLSAAIYVHHGSPGFGKLEALDRHKVAIVADLIWPDLIAAKGSKAEIAAVADVATALHALLEGKADAFVGDPITTGAALDRLSLRDKIDLSGQLDLEAPLAFAVRADWPQLREVLDIALKSISVEDEKSLRARWLAPALSAQDQTAATTLPASNASAVTAALKALPAQRDLSDDLRKQTDDLLHQAQDDNARADQFAQQLQTMKQTADSAETDAQKLEESLAQDDTGALLTWRAALPERATVEQLETLLAREREALADSRNSAATLEAELRRQSARPAQVRDELTAAHAILDNAANAAPDQTVPATLASAQRLRMQAAQRLATVQIAVLDLENRSYEPRMRLLSAQLRERQRAGNAFGQHVAALENLVLNRIGEDVADLRARVARERTDVGSRSRLLAEAGDTNITMCDQLARAITRLTELRTQKQTLDATRQDTAQALENTSERIRIGGVSEAVGLILLAEQRKLKPLPQLKRQLAGTQTELAKTRMDLIDLRERQTALNDIGNAVEQALPRAAEIRADTLADLRAGLYRLLNTRAEIVPRLIAQQARLASALAEAEQELRELAATTEKLGVMLDSRLLWTPSHTPVNLAWLMQLPQDAADFFGSRRWVRAPVRAADAALGQPVASAICLLSLIGLVWLGRRSPQRFEALAAPMRRIRTDRYRLTWQALVWTVLRAAPAPLALYILGKLWQQAAVNGSSFSEGLGHALTTLVLPAAVLAFLRTLTMEGGMAQYHFRWPRPRREALHAAVPALALLLLPAIFFVTLISLPGSDAPLDTLGRLLLALALAGVGWLGWRLFAPGRVWTQRNVVLREPLRVRQFVRIALACICGVLVLLDLLGYFVTANVLSAHLLESLAAFFAVVILHGLAARWLVLGERRLALKRMLEKQASADAESERERSEGEALPELPEVEEITIANVSAQTRRLLRALTLVGTVSALLWIWSDITPALSFLGNIAVWDSSQLIDGKEIALHVSLRDILEALVVLALTWVATRNLPGLLEVGMLRRLHVDAATRYALTSVTRYLILFTGMIFGLAMLGLRWSNLQWLAAGFSVGLGFGMQEIFANFISGLIVLFERPFRIGDVISIGGVEGTVARIRTRATTIVDWDNKEVVVPNKSFITDRLVNWTLSDTTTRIVIKVGIAYRNDPAQAQQLLLEIAAAHPQVLADPAPNCWMIGFGDSTQDFELRVYVGEINQRNPVRTELQMRIVQMFREHDIEIAFPQRDVWLRNAVEVNAPSQPAAPSAQATSASKRT